MHVPYAILRLDDGPEIRCYPGAILGRLGSARIRVPHTDVPEAAALVSARGAGLFLLALRRPLTSAGASLWNVELRPGQIVEMGRNARLHCVEVVLPTETLAVSLSGSPLRALTWGSYALRPDAAEWLALGEDGDWSIHCTEGDWLLEGPPGTQLLHPEATFEVAGRPLVVSTLPREGVAATASVRRIDPVSIELLPTQVFVGMGDSRVEVPGLSAALIRYLHANGGAVKVQAAARRLWGRAVDTDWDTYRDNLYSGVLWRLDQRLRQAGVRDDVIVRRDGWLRFGPEVIALIGPIPVDDPE